MVSVWQDPTRFLARQRRILGTASALFDDVTLNDYRDQEIEELDEKYIRKYVTDNTQNCTTSVFYTMPPTFTKVRRIEFWDYDPEGNSTALKRDTANDWNDRERSGYIRINDAPIHFGNLIYLIGEGPYTSLSDMTSAAASVVLYGSAVRALESQVISRAFLRASQAASRRSDVTLASISALLTRLDRIYQNKIEVAKKSVAVVGTN